MNYLKESTRNYTLNNPGISESAEEGLNINEIKNILLRRFSLIVMCTLGFGSLALLKILTVQPTYVAGFELLSEPVNIETKVTSTNEDSRKTREEISDVNLDAIQLKILKSPNLMMRIINKLKNKYPDLSYGDLISNLSVDIISGNEKEQNVLTVIYENSDRELVADVVKALAEIYQDYSVEKRQSGVKKGIAFLDRQIPQINDQSREIETKIAQLRTQYGFNDPDTSLEQITTRINSLDQRREENALKLQELELSLDSLDRELTINPAKLTSARDFVTPRYTELLSRLREIDLKISQKSVVFSEQSEILQALRKERQQLNLLIKEAGIDIQEKLISQITVLENRQESLRQETEKLKARLRQWSEIAGQYRSLQHRLNRANNKINEFTFQKDALQIDAAQKGSPWQLLTPPQEPTTEDMNAINYLILGSSLGLSLGMGLAILIDKQQNIIYSSAEVEQITNLPILAAIPHSGKRVNNIPIPLLQPANYENQVEKSSLDSILLQKTQKRLLDYSTPCTEAFRSFAANIGLLNLNENSDGSKPNNILQSIVITSAIPREGKSTVAMNLAKATASVGKRVLIVDADLRSTEHIKNSMDLESQIGLRNILEQNLRNSGLNYIQQLPSEDNLFVLTSGFSNSASNQLTNKDSSLLLASVKMHSLMEELEKQFDLVIYNLCSIIGFADVNLLANHIDGIILVTGLGKIRSAAFTDALTQLKLCNAPVMGVVSNQLVNKN